MRNSSFITLFFITGAIAFCLWFGAALSSKDIFFVFSSIALFSLWTVSLLIFGARVYTTLLFITLFWISPNINAFYIVLVLLLLSSLFELYFSPTKKRSLPYPIIISLLLFAGSQALLRAYSIPNGVLPFITTCVVPLLLLFIVSNSSIAYKEVISFIKILVIVTAFVAFYGIIIALLNPNDRLGSFWITAMTINGFYIISFFLSLFLYFSESHYKKESDFVWLLTAGIIFLGMVYTYTRISLLAIPFGLFLLMCRIKQARKFGLIALLLIPVIIPTSMVSRVQVGFTSDVSIYIRLYAWYNAFFVIKKHFFFGIGFNTWAHWYRYVVPVNVLYAEHPHNTFIRCLVEMGFFGFMAYFSLIFVILRKFWIWLKDHENGKALYVLLIAPIAVLFAGLTDVFIIQFPISLMFWTILALLYKLSTSEPSTLNKV